MTGGRGRHFRGSSHGSTPHSSRGSSQLATSTPPSTSTRVGPVSSTQPNYASPTPRPEPTPSSEGSHPESPLTPGNLSTTDMDDISGRKRLRVDKEGNFVGSSSIAARCTNIASLKLVAEGWNWAAVPGSVRKDYWDEFKKYYWWEENEERAVMEAFFTKMGKRYSGNQCTWRTKDKRPDCVPEEVWKAWKVHWASEDFQTISARQKANRGSERGGPGTGPSRHTAGSRSIADHARAWENEHGAPPSKMQLFDLIHMTKLDNNTRVYVDERAKDMGEKLKKKKKEFLYASDDTPHTDSDGMPVVLTKEVEDRLYMNVMEEDLSEEDGRSHRYMYGTGKNKECSMKSDASKTVLVTPEMQEMKEKIKFLEQTIVEKDATQIEKEKHWDAKHAKLAKMVEILMQQSGIPPSSPTSESE